MRGGIIKIKGARKLLPLIIAAALAISAVSYMLLLRLHEEKVLSESEIERMVKEDPGDRRLLVEPGTVEIQTAELMDFEQLPENERRFIGQWDVSKREYVSGGHEKVWVVEYECVGSESGPGMVIYSGKMRVRRVLDAFTGERLLRQVLNLSFETISHESGFYSRYKNHKYLVTENSEEWERIWSLAMPEWSLLPEIDFSTHTVIAVFMGVWASGGFEILIEQIIDAENEIIVNVKEIYPGRIGTTLAFTWPHHIIKIERVQKPIVFEVRQFKAHAHDENWNPYDEIIHEFLGEYHVEAGSGPPEPSI